MDIEHKYKALNHVISEGMCKHSTLMYIYIRIVLCTERGRQDRRLTEEMEVGVCRSSAVLYILCTDVHRSTVSPAASHVFTLHVYAVIAP